MTTDGYADARTTLESAWESRALDPSDDPTERTVRDLVWSREVSTRYAVPTQLLLKATYPEVGATRITELGDLPFTGTRYLCRHVVVTFNERLGFPLGDSGDPYVSNPLRTDSIPTGGKSNLDRLGAVLELVDSAPDLARTLLEVALGEIERRVPTLRHFLEAAMAAQARWVQDRHDGSERRLAVVDDFGPFVLGRILGEDVKAKGRAGVGNEAEIPWLAIFRQDQHASARTGAYPVYLFHADGRGASLSLGLGTEGKTISAIKAEAAAMRETLGDRVAGMDTSVDLKTQQGSGSRPRKYEAGTIAAFTYGSPLPEEEVLLGHLQHAIALAAVDLGGQNPEATSLGDVVSSVSDALLGVGLGFGGGHLGFVRSFVVSLATKGFVLLTGLSGSGKSRLGLAFGQWLGGNRVWVEAVRPDWTGPDALLGFEDGLSERVGGRLGWQVPDVLEFMLGAAGDPSHPYLLLLDEMNLAHVERYFADVLSGMESGAPVVPNLVKSEDGVWREEGGEPRLPFPRNLMVVGTVNIDETTYMFSPKVLDRANTLEFRVATGDLVASVTPIGSVSAGSEELVTAFLDAASSVGGEWSGRDLMAEWLRELHELLAGEDREFGHRVFYESLRFGWLLAEAGESDPLVALDLQVMQKILPRVHGSIRQVGSTLERLGAWCYYGPGTPFPDTFDPLDPPEAEPQLPVSFDKISRMTRRLRSNHFVSYAE